MVFLLPKNSLLYCFFTGEHLDPLKCCTRRYLVTYGSSLPLDGSASTDPDGNLHFPETDPAEEVFGGNGLFRQHSARQTIRTAVRILTACYRA